VKFLSQAEDHGGGKTCFHHSKMTSQNFMDIAAQYLPDLTYSLSKDKMTPSMYPHCSLETGTTWVRKSDSGHWGSIKHNRLRRKHPDKLPRFYQIGWRTWCNWSASWLQYMRCFIFSSPGNYLPMSVIIALC
jgi:hypothetical protein